MLDELAGSGAPAPDQTAAEPGQTAQPQSQTTATEGDAGLKSDEAPKQFSQDDVNKLIRDRLARERRNYDRRMANLEAQLTQVTTPRQQPAQAAAEPTLEQFKSYEDFQRALIKHEAGKLFAEQSQASREAQARAESDRRAKEAARSFQTRAETFRDTVSDYDEVVEPVLQGGFFPPAVDAALADYLGESEHGPAVAYALGNDAKLMAKLARLSPVAAVRELARVEMTLEATTKPATKAPEPVRPLSGRSADASNAPSDKDSIDVWLAKRNAELKARRG
jgi:hypothetical protein